MAFNLDEVKKAAEKAIEWGKEHPDEVKKGIEKVKEILPKKK